MLMTPLQKILSELLSGFKAGRREKKKREELAGFLDPL